MSLNQREGVYVTIMNFLADQGINFDDGQAQTAQEILGKTGRKAVVELICFGLLGNEIEMKSEARSKYSTEASMMKYASELVSNWLRKDPRLNGGEKYVPANPGSRAGTGDSMIKELKKLRTVQEQAGNTEAVTMIDDAITARTQELGLEKAKVIEIDTSKLPAHLIHLVK